MYQDPNNPKYGPNSPRQLAFIERLKELAAERPGVRRTTVEIAKACGCCKEYVRKLEMNALKKLRRRLFADPDFKQLLHQLGESPSGRMFEQMLANAGAS